MHIGRCGDGREGKDPITHLLPRSVWQSVLCNFVSSVGREALATGSESDGWAGGLAPCTNTPPHPPGHAPSRVSLAQRMVTHGRCTKGPMEAGL